MEKGIRQKRYQKFTRNGIEWTEWFNWNGPEEKWQLKGKLRNEYRTIPSPGGSSIDGEAAAAKENDLQPSLFPEGSLNYHKEGKQLFPSSKKNPQRKRGSSLQESNKRNWMELFSPKQATATDGKINTNTQQLSLFT